MQISSYSQTEIVCEKIAWAGVGVLKLVNMVLAASGGMGLLKTTEIDMGIALLAVFIMVLSGIFAGTFPARKAAKIEPVAAMRYENRG